MKKGFVLKLDRSIFLNVTPLLFEWICCADIKTLQVAFAYCDRYDQMRKLNFGLPVGYDAEYWGTKSTFLQVFVKEAESMKGSVCESGLYDSFAR